MDDQRYIDELSKFIWKQVSEYYTRKLEISSNINFDETFKASVDNAALREEYENLKNKYDDLIHRQQNIDNELAKWKSLYTAEQHTTKLLHSDIEQYEKRVKMLTNELFTIKEDHKQTIASLKNEHKEQISYMRKQHEEEAYEKKKLLELFNERMEQEIEQRIEGYKRQNEELKKQNDYYYNLYVDKSKGKFYETELHPRLLEYNTKHMGGIWKIDHVGSAFSEKCDFVFKHKDSEISILMDTKNNINSKPVSNSDMDKFLRDVSLDENKAIGGILLANSRISNKKEFEINEHQGKTLVFISNYNQDNIGFIFSLLDLIYYKHKEDQKEVDTVKLKEGAVNDIQFLKERCNSVTNEKRKLENYLMVVENRFMELYGISIEEWKTKETAITTGEAKEKANEIIDFNELEKDRAVIGKRTKYYLCYYDERSGENKIQYFQNNSRKEGKMKKLGLL